MTHAGFVGALARPERLVWGSHTPLDPRFMLRHALPSPVLRAYHPNLDRFNARLSKRSRQLKGVRP